MPETRCSFAQFLSRMRILSTWIMVGGRSWRPAGLCADMKYSLLSSVPCAYSRHMNEVSSYSTGSKTSPVSKSLIQPPSILAPFKNGLGIAAQEGSGLLVPLLGADLLAERLLPIRRDLVLIVGPVLGAERRRPPRVGRPGRDLEEAVVLHHGQRRQ